MYCEKSDAEVSNLVSLHQREWRWHAKGVLIVEEVRYLSLKMEYVKVLHSMIYLVRILEDDKFPSLWLMFHTMGLTIVLKMVRMMRRNISK
ncbi:hypothetical protein OIU74_008767 [Salix koriyanagi]|uniref:Uncharacterized protein n=1 Tax=Salix koriyanagi TaxID=2511006 RepID=A0A9Q0Z010_9ROSI|nr:hypothetical protein OIU74_008767 [Salix koriyanagi]